MPLQTGQVLNDRYRIVKLLGTGGFGAVYRAWDTNFKLPCALKENYDTSPEAQRQFMREAQLLHTLRHPNLPLVKDYFFIEGQGQYLVMDYVEGDDLQEMLRAHGSPLPEVKVLGWMAEICQALEYLHTHTPPVIHRDIKPANIKITPEGKAVLVDFGISKVYDENAPTTQGARAVTPGYSPFEQYGHAPTNTRTDIYALGATAYTLLTGKMPVESLARMAGSELPSPRSLNPAVSAEAEAVVLHAMAVMPDQRYASAGEMRAALVQNIPTEPGGAKVQTAPQRAEAVPQRAEAVPQRAEAAPQRAEAAPQKADAAPQRAEAAPPKAEAAPQKTDAAQMAEAVPATAQASAVAQPEIPPPARPQPSPAAAKPPKAKKMGQPQAVAQPAAAKPKKGKRWLWIAIPALLVILGVVYLALGDPLGLFSAPMEPYEEGVITGQFVGGVDMVNPPHEYINMHLELNYRESTGEVWGYAVASFEDGHEEEWQLEGNFDGQRLRIRSSNGLFFRGESIDERFVGEAAFECFECPTWGVFEWLPD